MINLDKEMTVEPTVTALLEEYVSCLDRRAGQAWLDLFAPHGYYAVLREEEFEQANNVLLVGEDMKRLTARVVSGLERDTRRMVHTLGPVRSDSGRTRATAPFTVWMEGVPAYCGFYLIDLDSTEKGLRIGRCQVVLFSKLVQTPIFLPI
ncbi:hypothetical protein [Hydrogenophaga sp. OTU3427]|uniref:hypothetical protein n=1 Tax=Hydrogenophaga sp. OTU3427 TaxID=3043856 RepID=UPI00313DFAB0